MKDLSDEEYARLAEKWTKTTPKVGPNGSGYFSQRKAAAHTVTIILGRLTATRVANIECNMPFS